MYYYSSRYDFYIGNNKLTDKYREKIINKFNNQRGLLNEMQTSYYKNKLDEYDGELIIDNFIKRHR